MAEDKTSEQPPIVVIRGSRVGLGPLRRELVPLYQRWINDLEVTRTLAVIGLGGPITLEDEQQWYERATANRSDAIFTIYELSTLRPIGNCGLHSVSHRHGTATLCIAIGEKDCWNRGYGTEAVYLVLDYAFTVLELHNVMLTVYSDNPRAIRAYEKAGFRLFGRRREARRLAGQLHDELYMDALATEFRDSTLRPTLLGDKS